MGGNVFKDGAGNLLTQRISRGDVSTTVTWLELLTKNYKLNDSLLGTTGVAESSGDIDIAIPDYKEKSELVAQLTRWVTHQHPEDPIRSWIHKTGISVHFRTPICGNNMLGFVQTDFMFGNVDWLKWSLRGETTPGFKGRHRHILLSNLAKGRGVRWSPNSGVMTRDTGMTLTNKPEAVASYLLGIDATIEDVDNIDNIMHYIMKHPNWELMVSEAAETLSYDGISLIERYKLDRT